MSPQREALIIIEQMRRYGITAPSQQSTLLCLFERKNMTYGSLIDILGISKENVALIRNQLTKKDLMTYERPKKGFVREGKLNLTEKGRKLLEIGGQP